MKLFFVLVNLILFADAGVAYEFPPPSSVMDCSAERGSRSPARLIQCTAECNGACSGNRAEVDYHMVSPLTSVPRIALCNEATAPYQAVTAQVNSLNENGNCHSVPNAAVAPTTAQPIGEWLSAHLAGYPPNCGYNVAVRGSMLRRALQSQLQTGFYPSCQPSMCSSAIYFAFISALQHLRRLGRLPQSAETHLTQAAIPSPSYGYFNDLARPDRLMTELGIGEGRVLNPAQLNRCADIGWPRRGDFVQIWRANGSGHSMVFDGLLYDERGNSIGICYWSSNLGTRGFGRQCEQLEGINRVIVGRITL